MITIEKLEIYKKNHFYYFEGRDMTNRIDKKIINDNDWLLIREFLHDIELISKNLTSKEYAEKILKSLKENCDKDSFEILTKRIPFVDNLNEI